MSCHHRRVAVVLLSAGLLAGCQTMRNPEWNFVGAGRVHEAGAYQNIPATFEKVDLIALLDPETAVEVTRRERGAAAAAGGGDSSTDGLSEQGDGDSRKASPYQADLYRAYRRFRETRGDAARRNAIQDEILRASEQRCNVYKIHVRRLRSSTNFAYGGLTTLFGGLGALFTSIDVSRALSGAAGITSGLNAEFDQAYFANLATEVIIDGIESRRKRIHDEIVERRTRADLATYSVEAAVLDAVRFHGSCSIIEGLREASSSIKTVRDPGLHAMAETVAAIGRAKDLVDRVARNRPIEEIAAAAATPGRSALLGGAPLPSVTEELPLARVAAASAGAATLVAELRTVVERKKAAIQAAGQTDPGLDGVTSAAEDARARLQAVLDTVNTACDRDGELTLRVVRARVARDTAPEAERAEKEAAYQVLQGVLGIVFGQVEERRAAFGRAIHAARAGVEAIDPRAPGVNVADITAPLTRFTPAEVTCVRVQ
jgi:hypothetical protein